MTRLYLSHFVFELQHNPFGSFFTDAFYRFQGFYLTGADGMDHFYGLHAVEHHAGRASTHSRNTNELEKHFPLGHLTKSIQGKCIFRHLEVGVQGLQYDRALAGVVDIDADRLELARRMDDGLGRNDRLRRQELVQAQGHFLRENGQAGRGGQRQRGDLEFPCSHAFLRWWDPNRERRRAFQSTDPCWLLFITINTPDCMSVFPSQGDAHRGSGPVQASPSRRTALPFRMPGITSGLKPATSKSFIQRSGVISG